MSRHSGSGFLPASSPFAPPPPEEKKPTPQQQIIKVEVGEEIIAERKKAGKKVFLVALLVGVAAGFIGFSLGKLNEAGTRSRKAVAGAGKLRGDVRKANDVMKGLSSKLRGAAEELSGGDYPTDLGKALTTTVPFNTDNFNGKSVGGLPPAVLRDLLRYTSAVDELNKKRERLRNLLSLAKKPTLKYFKEKKEPVINFSVLFQRQGPNAVALLVPNAKPFKMSEKKWPAKYKVKQRQGKKVVDVETERSFKPKDNLFDGKKAIPVEPRSVAAFTSQKMVFELRKALRGTSQIIVGIESPRPDQQRDGLIKIGERLAEQLDKTSKAR